MKMKFIQAFIDEQYEQEHQFQVQNPSLVKYSMDQAFSLQDLAAMKDDKSYIAWRTEDNVIYYMGKFKIIEKNDPSFLPEKKPNDTNLK